MLSWRLQLGWMVKNKHMMQLGSFCMKTVVSALMISTELL
jgi:hypothetical protein